MNRKYPLSAATAVLFTLFACVAQASAEDLRIGIVGTDSSHAVEFTRILNDASAADHVPGAKIVAAYRGGNPSMAISRDRIERFTSTLKDKWHIPFIDAIRDLCGSTDGILILSVDPASRILEFQQAASCHKPIFVDKPAAANLHDLAQLDRIAQHNHIDWFSASALRFLVPAHTDKPLTAEVWGPGELGRLEDGYTLDLSWYGVHSLEMLLAAMGPGIANVSRIHGANADIVTAIWSDGRVGVVHLIRPHTPFRLMTFDRSDSTPILLAIDLNYSPLVHAIVHFFSEKTLASAMNSQTLELFAVMTAADTSSHKGGALVSVINPKLH